MSTTSLLVTVLGAIGTVCAILFGYLSFLRSRKLDDEREGKQNGALMAEMNHLSSTIDDVKRRLEKQEERSVEMLSRLLVAENACQQLRSRMDPPC